MRVHNLLSMVLTKDSFTWRVLESMYSIKYLTDYWQHYRPKAATTREIYLEFVSYCNLRCQLCSLDHSKPKVRMHIETLDRILNQLFYDRRFRKVQIIHLHNAGEALLHPEFKDMIACIKQHQEKFKKAGYTFPKLALLTNASILKPELSDFIICSNAFDYIRFSMDGGTPEAFEELRTRAKWSDFYSNVKYFLNRKKELKSKIHAGFISMVGADKKLNTAWMHNSFRELYTLSDSYELRHPHNWGGEVELNDGRNLSKKYKIGCSMLMKQLVFLPNGDITMCCSDLNSKGVIGNILEKSLFEIYNSHKRLNTIEHLFKNQKHQVDLCKNCPTY